MRRPDRLLRVDLSAGTVDSEPVPDRWLADFVGGKGLGARYLYAELSPGTDPLGPANHLVFATGPLTGYLPGEPRYAAVTKSPLTGTFLDSYAGGRFPGALAGALGDHALLLVTGRADEPVRLVLADGDARIEPTDAWGADAVETARTIGDATACIGPAGENRVAYATIASDAGDHHAGRGGAGAVMGSKRLKAVVARGDRPEPTGRLAALRDRAEARAVADGENRWLAAGGTYESVDFAAEADVLATRGWTERSFEGADEIGIERATAAAAGRERDDAAVPGGFRVPTDDAKGDTVPRGAAPMTLGAGLGIDDFDAVAELGALCDRLGVDVISAGNAVAWAVRAADAGHLRTAPAAFGDPAGARDLIERIARREDGDPLADALADGVRPAATRYGGRDLVPTVKGMELPAYDPRGAVGMALAYATSDRGACHRRARPIETEAFRARSPPAAARAVAREQTVRSALWCLVADDFLGGALADDLGAAWLAALDGLWPTEAAELRAVGERIWTLTRLFNLREGMGRTADDLPALFRADPEGIDREAFAAALDAYYAIRGWDATGRPTRATLARLGLADLECAGRPPTAGGTATVGRRSDRDAGSRS
jgi:aldehyde:ferredoxin oxidoreductase